MFSGSLIKVWLGVVPPRPIPPVCFSVCDRPVGAEWSGGIWADYIKRRLVEAGGGGGVVKPLRDFLVPSGRSSSSGS